jgi:hypothetical protein
MSQILKKTLSGIASVTTILWSVGGGLLALPGAASAATIVAGDLVKSPTASDVYYYAADGKRYVFPNEKTYKSWYADFSTVKTISGAELAALPLGANVTIRPGTKLVKITTDPKVYAVAPNGTLRWIETEAIAIALYGSNWAQRVVDVPDGYFVNYTVGASVSSAVHPDGTVIMYAGSSDMFVVWGGQKRKLVGDAFMMNGYQMSDVIVTTASYPNGTDVTGREGVLANTVNPGSVTGPVVGGTLMVSLASDTPAGMTLPKNAASAQLAKFNLMAGSGNVVVTGLRFHRVGIGATTDLSNVYLYDGNGNRLTTGRTVNSTTNNVEFNSLNLNVAAGQTMSVVLVGDLSSPSSTGGQHSFELVDAASVVVTGGSTVSGSFPVRGNVFTVGTSSAGTITVERGNTLSNPNIGAAEAEISSFKLTSSLHDIEVRRVTLLSAGSVSNSDLSDFKLYQGTTLVATAATMSGDKIVLNFVPPYVITNGTSRIFTLKAKVAGRSARTIRTYVEYSTDVYAIDRTYNTGAAVTISSYDGDSGSASSCTGTEESCVTTQGGQLTVTFNGPTAQNISRGAQDVVLYRFSLASPESNLEIRNLRFKIASTNSGRVRGSSNTDYFTDIKVKNMANGQTLMGPTSLGSGTITTDSGTITLSDSFNIQMGQILDLAITADLSNSEDADRNFFTNGTSTYQVTLGSSGVIFGSSDIRITDTGEYLATNKIVPNTSIVGNTMTVKPSSLALAMVSNPSSGTVVKNASNVPVAGFSFTAGSQTDNIITAITLKAAGDSNGNGASYTLAEADDVVTGCGLFDGDTQVGQSRAPDATTGEMSITSLNLRVTRGTTKTLVVKCSTVSSVSTSGYRIAVGISAVTAQDADANTVTVTVPAAVSAQYAESGAARVNQNIISGGTLTISTNNLRTSTILVAGNDTWQNVAEYRATAQNEDIRIEKVAVSSTGDAANLRAVAIAMDGAVKGGADGEILPSGVMRYKTVDISSSPINVMRNTSVSFNIWAKIDAAQASSTVNGATSGVALSGNQFSLGIASGITSGDDAWDSNYFDKLNVRAVGIGSGNLVYATSSAMLTTLSGNTFVLRKSKPTVTQQALSTTTLAAGQQMDLYKFQVSADAAGSVALKKITFAVSVSTSTSGSSFSLNNFRIRKGSTEIPVADVVITDRAGADVGNATFAAATGTPRIVVSFTNGTGGGEETISGSGTVYTLVANTAGTIVAGDQVSTSFDRSGDISAGTVTGYLTAAGGTIVGPNLDTAAAPGATASPASFVWSDLSEIPHSDQVGASGGSRDWTNGYLVDDLTRSQTLTK